MIVHRWHTWVNQPKEDIDWHKTDIADELKELQEATSVVNRWSELSDVVYTVTRGRWSGHDLEFPINRRQQMIGYAYMFPKYSSRALFFRRAGKKAGASQRLESVRNPKKVAKLENIARQNGINPESFIKICQKQRKYWPLLP